MPITEAGITTDTKPQLSKAIIPMSIRERGSSMVESDVALVKAKSPIVVNELGRDTEVKLMQ